MKKRNITVLSMVPGRQFVNYEEHKTVKELYKYAYSQLRLFSQKGAEYSFGARDFETRETIFWLHGFKNRVTGLYEIVGHQGYGISKTIDERPIR